MSTNALAKKDIKRQWHVVDAKGKVLGRLATQVATLIMGKNKQSYVPYLDTGDHVVVTNAKEVVVTGQKEKNKVYFRHSGYPGGDKRETLEKLRLRKPEQVITHAVTGMVPKTRLGREMLKKLHVFGSSTHPYAKQLKEGEVK